MKSPETLNTIARRKAAVMKIRPLLILVILIPLISFMMYPMMNMKARDIHVGIVNLDKGAHFDQGDINLGDKMLDSILHPEPDEDGETVDSPIVWTVYDSETEASAAVENKDVYGYLVIPKKFSKNQTKQLKALGKLSEALGTMSEGSGKLGSAVSTMSGKLGKLPVMFGNLSEATAGLHSAAEGLQTAAGAMNSEAGAITEAAVSLQTDNASKNENLRLATEAITALQETDPAELTDEMLLDALAEIQGYLDAASEVDSSQPIIDISKNATMITAQSAAAEKGLGKVKTAEQTMSENFSTMSKNMGKVGNGTGKLSAAIGTLSSGLDEMSGKLDDQVGDAIDTINGDNEDAEEDDADDNSSLRFVLDQSRNVMISSTLTSAMNAVSANAGMKIDMEYRNEIPEERNNMYFVMVFMMLTMFTSMIPGILTGLMMRSAKSRNQRLKTLVIQLLLAFAIAPCLGCCLPRVIQWMGDTPLPVGELSRFICIASFSLLILIIGSLDLIGIAGAAVPALIMLCGTAVANLPYEYLPVFWQKYVYPWEPLRFIADGIRTMLYWDGGWWNEYAQKMLFLAAIGGVLMLLAIAKPTSRAKANLPLQEA